MPGFLNVRVAPGVRLSASGRGLRAHVGPRSARLHFGGGSSGVSTGAGPFTYYKSVQSANGGRSATADAGKQKAAEAEQIRSQLRAIDGLHRYNFAAPVRPTASLPELPPFADLLYAAEVEHLNGVGLIHRQERAKARVLAREATERHCRVLLARARREQAERQTELDGAWSDLLANDEDTVLLALESAFEDNQAPAAAVGLENATAYVSVIVPRVEALPDRIPTTTVAGNLSLKKMTKSQRATWYLPLVAGHVVATAKETMAACPGLSNVTVVALRKESQNQLAPILATNLSRDSLQKVAWAEVSAWEVIERLGRDTRVRFKGVAREITPLDLSDEPSLKPLIDALS